MQQFHGINLRRLKVTSSSSITSHSRPWNTARIKKATPPPRLGAPNRWAMGSRLAYGGRRTPRRSHPRRALASPPDELLPPNALLPAGRPPPRRAHSSPPDARLPVGRAPPRRTPPPAGRSPPRRTRSSRRTHPSRRSVPSPPVSSLSGSSQQVSLSSPAPLLCFL